MKIRPSTQLLQDGAATSDVLTWDGTEWIPSPPGGGNGATILTASAAGTNAGGDYSTTSTSLVDVGTISASIAAVAGDVLELMLVCSMYEAAATGFGEVAFRVASTDYLVLNIWVPMVSAGAPIPVTAVMQHTVVSGDISGGNVALKPRWMSASGYNLCIVNSGGYVPMFLVKNLGH